ncbi:Hypothetical predicted protein [Octopus vulgaris]|uniref:Uncharacterized protein n=1 Tax=Octopus vulgaris TaxID=6645 RepID=A0AA36ALW9_OCTVU|nr:Hypothetical predicted protein [Octopus vulgaris]
MHGDDDGINIFVAFVIVIVVVVAAEVNDDYGYDADDADDCRTSSISGDNVNDNNHDLRNSLRKKQLHESRREAGHVHQVQNAGDQI